MTSKEAVKMIKAKLDCMCRSFSGRDEDCNRSNCDNCNLNYEQGTVGEQTEALRVAISALQAQDSKRSCDTCKHDPPSKKYPCVDCDMREPADRWEQRKQLLEALPSAEPEKVVCIANITLSEEQLREMVEKVKNEIVQVFPSAEQRKTGRWQVLDECSNEGIYCSICHKKVFKLDLSNTMKWKNFKFCPNCGAKMENARHY